VENSVNASTRCVGTSLLVTAGVLDRVGPDAIAASFCKVFRPRDAELAPMIHYHLRYLRAEDKMRFYQNVATNGIANFQATRFVGSEAIALPTDRDLLATMMDTLWALSTTNFADRNAVLREARDLLLPRLVSGEIDVSELEIEGGG